MSAAVEVSTSLSTQDAIDAVWEAVLDGTYPGAAAAARALWPALHIDATSLDLLALEGLIALTMEQKHNLVANGKRVPWGAPHGKKFEKYIALTWPFERADGSHAPLLKFSRSDLAALAARAGRLAKSWDARREWAIATDTLLVQHGVETIAKLPQPALAEVAELAMDAFGRQG